MKRKNRKEIIIACSLFIILIFLFIFRPNIINFFSRYKSGLELLKGNGNLISDSELASLEDSGITGSEYNFDTDYYPYYGMLNNKEKKVYKQVYGNIVKTKSKIVPLEKVSTNRLTNIIESIYNDHPELFWIDNSYSYKYTKNNYCAQIILKYNSTINDLENAKKIFNNKVDYIISNAKKYSNNYDREKYVHDFLINNISYNENASLNQTAYSAIVNGKTVCAGYARAFQYILTKLGIPTYYCVGYSENQNHAWNIVLLDDGYYNVDVTWDDSTYSRYLFFNRTDNDFSSSHMRENLSKNLPKCNATKYRGYVKNNIKIDTDSNNNDSTVQNNPPIVDSNSSNIKQPDTSKSNSNNSNNNNQENNTELEEDNSDIIIEEEETDSIEEEKNTDIVE